MSKLRLKSKMSVLVSLLLTASLSLTMYLAMQYLEQEFRRTITRDLQALTAAVAVDIDGKLASAARLAEAVARRIDPALLADPAGLDRFLRDRIAISEVFDNGLYIFSADGRMLAGTHVEAHMRRYNFSSRDYVQATVASRRPFISRPFLSIQRSRHPIIMVTAPLFGPDGGVVGLVGGSIDLFRKNFLDTVHELRIGSTGHLSLLDGSGTVIHHPDHQRILKRLPAGTLETVYAESAASRGSGETVDPGGVPVLAVFQRLQAADWTLAAEIPLAEAYAPIEQARRTYFLGMLLMVGLSVAAVWAFMGRLTAPLRELTGHVGRITRGEGAGEAVPIRSGDEIGTLAAAFRDLLATVRLKEQDIQRQRELAENLILQSAAPIFVIDRRHRVIAWNRACAELTGLSEADVKGTDRHWRAFYDRPRPCLVDLVIDGHPADLAALYKISGPARLIDEGLQAEGWRTTPDGRRRYLIFSAAPIRDASGEIVAAIETLEDITERKEAEKRLVSLAHHDALTGLPNRACFFDRLDRGIAAALDRDHPLALLYLDLDGFKQINDTLGHDAGDLVLTEVGRRLACCVRESDTVARIGGDEFTILLARVDDRAEATRIAERILEALAQPFVYGCRRFKVGGSIGISLFPEDGRDADTLLKMGDSAMYQVKAGNFDNSFFRRTGS